MARVGTLSERRDRRGLPGGIVSGDPITVAATLAVLGHPAERYLTTHDAEERLVLSALAQKAARIVNELQRNQGVHIANAMVKAKLRG
jgi:general stress protein 26